MILKKYFEGSSTRNQYLSAIAVNLIVLSHGCAMGWTSPFIPYLQSAETHLTSGPLTYDDVSWIGSVLSIGGIIGTFMFSAISQKFGKRTALFLLIIPHVLFWVLIYFATHAYHLYLARALAGLTGGGALRTISVYVSEISESRIRGSLGSLMILALSSGIFIVFVAGAYLSYFFVPIVLHAFPTMFFISLFFIHDTPSSLLNRNKNDEAFESLKFYRTCGDDKTMVEIVAKEFELLKKTVRMKKEVKLELADFFTKHARNGIITSMFLMFLNQFSGMLVIFTYSAFIFKKAGSSLSPNDSSIIVAFIQLIGVCVSLICVDRFGRKILMIISTIGSAIFLAVLAGYGHLNNHGYDVSEYKWIPVTSLSLAIFVASLGIISLPFVISMELLPIKIKEVGATISMCMAALFAFIALKLFPLMVDRFMLYNCIWFFAGICLLGTLVTILFIPETKAEILDRRKSRIDF